jgi:TetR/AcrR family transcriptional repressor of mexJK operon
MSKPTVPATGRRDGSNKTPAKPAAPRRRTRPGPSREDMKRHRAEALLDAAWSLFCEVGYEKLTIEDVADRAGYSRQPVYTLFGDKQTLFFELQSRATRQVMELLFAYLQRGKALRELLGALAEAVAAELNSNKPTYGERLFIVSQTIALSRPDIAAKVQQQARRIIDEIARMIRLSPRAEGDALRGSPEVIATYLAAQINGLTTVQYQTGEHHVTAKELRELFLFFVFKTP